ncbi:hypothetical protein CTI12_AA624930 [Artemisia annua]|uniref:Uncharacterized protein n=1 Tax=Artemisia annua TaxID=35608 RepID=A0A2U1KAP1_ARTAN|nr:hypothetical protein CTI12_AA624930 [Artemisia annua]
MVARGHGGDAGNDPPNGDRPMQPPSAAVECGYHSDTGGSDLQRALQRYKNKFKEHMFVNGEGYEHPQERKQFPPGDMALSEWNKYVDYVTTPKHMARAEKNKANRKKQLYSSNHGTKSYDASRFDEVRKVIW